jgi:serine/threonine protein kinase
LRAQVYDKDPQWPGGIPEDLQLEIDLLKKLRHPHVVELFEVVLSEAHVFLVQELLSGGELFEHLLSRGACKEAEAKDIFAQVVLALDYLHELHVAHRDIKAENLVFTRRGHSQLKLIDFGTADTWTEAEGLMHCVGTPSYISPEAGDIERHWKVGARQPTGWVRDVFPRYQGPFIRAARDSTEYQRELVVGQ